MREESKKILKKFIIDQNQKDYLNQKNLKIIILIKIITS